MAVCCYRNRNRSHRAESALLLSRQDVLRFWLRKQRSYAMSSLVTIRYGPYESCGVVNYKTFRLEGLQAVLRDCGYVCVLEEAPDWNQVELLVHGESVYQCDINKLEFGGDGQLDPLCQEALEAVRNAYHQHQISY